MKANYILGCIKKKHDFQITSRNNSILFCFDQTPTPTTVSNSRHYTLTRIQTNRNRFREGHKKLKPMKRDQRRQVYLAMSKHYFVR